jgi:hypothetical protein
MLDLRAIPTVNNERTCNWESYIFPRTVDGILGAVRTRSNVGRRGQLADIGDAAMTQNFGAHLARFIVTLRLAERRRHGQCSLLPARPGCENWGSSSAWKIIEVLRAAYASHGILEASGRKQVRPNCSLPRPSRSERRALLLSGIATRFLP